MLGHLQPATLLSTRVSEPLMISPKKQTSCRSARAARAFSGAAKEWGWGGFPSAALRPAALASAGEEDSVRRPHVMAAAAGGFLARFPANAEGEEAAFVLK